MAQQLRKRIYLFLIVLTVFTNCTNAQEVMSEPYSYTDSAYIESKYVPSTGTVMALTAIGVATAIAIALRHRSHHGHDHAHSH